MATLTMYWTAALISSSEAVEPPLGGITPFAPVKPSMACLNRVASPWAIRGAQSALSSSLGAPATPATWQAWQVDL